MNNRQAIEKIHGYLVKRGQKAKQLLINKFKSSAKSFGSFLVKHYFGLNLWASLYAVFGIPIQLLLIGNVQFLNISLAMIFIVFPIGITIPAMAKTAEVNPYSFVKTLNLRDRLFQLFWILAGVVVLLWIIFFVIAIYYTNYLPSEFALILPAFMFSYVGVSLVEVLIGGAALGLLFSGKIRVNLRLCARAYFRVAADCLFETKNRHKVCNFKKAVEYLNAYLKSKYGLQLKGQEYSNYFKIAAFAGNDKEKQRVKEATNNLAEKLKEDIGLNEVLVATRNICGKPAECSLEERTSELDFDIGAKKWFSQHKETIGLIVAVISIVTAIIWR